MTINIIQKAKKLRLRQAALTAQLVEAMGTNPDYGMDAPMEDFVLMYSGRHPATYGKAIERRIIYDMSGERISDKEQTGDLRGPDGATYEIKTSMLVNDKMMTNFVQVRPWQPVTAYIFAVYDTRDLLDIQQYYFLFTAAEMDNELKLCNAASAHGPKQISKNKKGELRFSFPATDDSETWNRWLDTYLVDYDVLTAMVTDGLELAA